ncbi:MAG: DUF3108 domain-containing protein [Dysgonamonadaceae bacterium]|jgi:hypothetical protein|nr:DUF3108 domain-containing protein [Dysgonamonadaceae bacterium]
MKIKQIQTARLLRCRGCRFNLRTIVVLFFFFAALIKTEAQGARPFPAGELLKFDVKYKYGLIHMKGGTANYRTQYCNYDQKKAVCSSLDFKTTSFFDKIHKMRDTLISYASIPFFKPLFHHRSVDEGNAYFIEEMNVLTHNPSYSEMNVKRYKNNEMVIDTIIKTDVEGYDILNILLVIRNADFDKLEIGEKRNVATFLGRRKVNVIIRYDGQSILEKNKNHKFNTRKFSVDITDDVFTETSEAMTVWISDDENRIPIKMKAKLKIGAAEANLTSYKNLTYPLSSEIILK